MKKIATAVFGGLFMVIATTSAAFAVIEYPPEGGTWDYGRSGSNVWSYYINTTPQHATSTVGQSGLRRSPCAGRDQWARINDTAKVAGNHAYYRNTCP